MIIATMTALVYATNSPWIHVCLGFLPFFFTLGLLVAISTLIHTYWATKKLALTSLIVKLINVPAYVFIVGVIVEGASSLQNQLWNLLFAALLASLLQTGLYAMAGIRKAKQEKRIEREFLYVFSSFLLVVDIVAAVRLYNKCK
jgi:hypothetical protein